MEQREQKLSRGMDLSGVRIYSRFSFLGDGVGVGKSLMVLGHIARLKNSAIIPNIPLLDKNNTSQMYSLHDIDYSSELSEVGCLIVVPHTLYRQWQNYIKEQTNLKCLGVQTKRVLAENAVEKIREAEIVLVSNTLYGQLIDIAHTNKLFWKRVFIDEADTIHIPSTRRRPETRFTWLISASWSNLLLPNSRVYGERQTIQTLANTTSDVLDNETKELLKSFLQQSGNGQGCQLYYYVVSGPFLHDFIYTNNSFRGRLVLRCRDDFVKESTAALLSSSVE